MAKKRGRKPQIAEEKEVLVSEVETSEKTEEVNNVEKKEIKPTYEKDFLTLKKLIDSGKAKIYRKDTEIFTNIDSDVKSITLHDNMILVIEIPGVKKATLHPAYRFRARVEVFEDVIIVEPRHKVRLVIPQDSVILTIVRPVE